MPKAARIGDKTAHGGVVKGPGCPGVFIGGQVAACLADDHACPVGRHKGGPILPPCSATVFWGGKPAARVGDKAQCRGATDTIAEGCASVFVGG
jgi:uncharacterized Zn-binding protein involved in type VI secretion